MVDRLTVLMGAGVITAGLSAGLLASPGVALATVEPGTSSATSTAEPEDSSAPSEEPEADAPGTDDVGAGPLPDGAPPGGEPAADPGDPDGTGADGDADPVGDVEQSDVAEQPEVVERADVAEQPEAAERPEAAEQAEMVEEAVVVEQPVVVEPADVVDETVEQAQDLKEGAGGDLIAGANVAPLADGDRKPSPFAEAVPTSTLAPLATLRAADSSSQSATTPARQTLLSLIGTAIFSLYSVAIRVLGGPPLLPPGSGVTVRSSTLQIDCGEGYDVPADWYVPEGATAATRLIHLQHGFMASGAFYSYTAARLALATDSIVVATSLTSNFLACDGCWVGGSPMHKAVADLFVDGNNALAQSALAAGYSSTLLDGVQNIALIGHSAGGGLAVGTAGYMTQNGSFDKLVGAVMLDGVGFGDVTPEALAKLPRDFRVYNLGARAYFWNLSGTTNTAMNDWRPDGFNGVKLDNGSHGDTMTGGNPLVQIAMNLVTGWPRAENVEAAELISAGWINDMFTGTRSSAYYGEPGEVIEIRTSGRDATARVLPGESEYQTIIDVVFTWGAKIVFGIDFATCAAGPSQISGFSAQDTLLSLDGRAKAGQSIGQQCVHG